VLYVQGTTRNQVLFYPRFNHIVLLSAPATLEVVTTVPVTQVADIVLDHVR
jgi:hypothetical protein